MKETTNRSVAIYVRSKSHEVPVGHILLLQAYAGSAGLSVKQIFRDNSSAHADSLPGLMALNAAFAQGDVNTVLVVAPEVLFRGKYLDTELFCQILFRGVDIIAPYAKPLLDK